MPSESELRLTTLSAQQIAEAEADGPQSHCHQPVQRAIPGERLDADYFLGDSERHQLLVEWNATSSDYPRDQCLHELFEAQVDRTPDAVAVVFEDRQVSYRELNERANQVAHALRRLGVLSDTLVGLCLERSPEMVIGILGILKAGGAYLPLDADYPPQRLEFMLQDAALQFLVTTKALQKRLPVNEAQVVCLNGDSQLWKSEACHNPTNKTLPRHLAYVMYTSGSTGMPKGVEILHQGIVRLLFGVNYASLDGSRTLLHLSPSTFDASTFEIWGALLHGARCVLLPNELPTTNGLRHIVEQSQVDTLWLTAALFNRVMDEDPLALQGIRQLLIGGEALSVSHVQIALDHLPATQIVNGYGPTESTTFACCYRIPHTLADAPTSIPIGRPISNTRVYVLDADENLVPIGVAGELYIGGDGLARGYLNRPELTAEKFLRDPFSEVPGARMYRTGDQVRWRADGNLEFLGRLDHQVKLRGFRIELGEIEATLLQHPQVRQAVVLLREDRPGDKRLVAYLVPQSTDTPPAAVALRQMLQEKLPDYMVPAAFVFLDVLPLTLNGKIDRQALPPPDASRPDLVNEYVAPRNPIEESIAAIWCDLLNLQQVGVHDDFFMLGGHSLMAVQVIERLNRQQKASLQVVDLFRLPTIGQLGEFVALPQQGPDNDMFLSEIRPPTERGSVVWIGGHLTELLKSMPSSIGIIRMGLDGLDTETFHRLDIDTTVDRYATELLRTGLQGPLVIVGFSYSGLLAFALALRLRSSSKERVELVLLDPTVPQSVNLHENQNLLARILRYCQKLAQSGPIVLYRSVEFRLKHYWEEAPSGLDAEAAKQWARYLPHYLHNIATYWPSQPLPGRVHLVASSLWLAQYLEVFQSLLQETPHVYDLGEVGHLEVVKEDDCVTTWMQLIDDLLRHKTTASGHAAQRNLERSSE